MTEHSPITASPQPFRLSVDDYLLLDGSGAFKGCGKTELLQGTIYCMNAQHRPHARAKSRLHLALGRALETLAPLEALVEASIALSPHDVPEPDIVITRESDGSGLVPLVSVALIVEVSDTTIGHDLSAKLAIYAAAMIPEYWVLDVNGATIHQFWNPDGSGYGNKLSIALGQPIAAATMPGLIVETIAI